jgi:hypothetical protein
MKKYVIYRTQGKIAHAIRKHELAGVEFGKNVSAAEAAIRRAIRADAMKLPAYKGYSVTVTGLAPVNMSRNIAMRTRRTRF